MEGQLDAAGLGVFTNFWSYISEATKAEDDDQSTWTLYPPETTASMGLPGRDLLGDVSISFSKENSIVPHTIGPKQKPPGEECMVVFYCNADNVRNKVAQFVHQLKHQSSAGSPLLLIQMVESSFRADEAQWLSHHPSYTLLGTCIVAEVYGGGSVERCRGIVSGLGVDAYVSSSPQQGAAEVESFTQWVSARLAVLTRQQISKSMAEKLDSESMQSQPI
ncbi:hypothetical protein EMCRGX_G023648 [Ephydatia muelleri]